MFISYRFLKGRIIMINDAINPYDKLFGRFLVNGNFKSAKPSGCGHINDTYEIMIKTPEGIEKRYILQRINHNVFKDPEKLMQNVENITKYLRKTITELGGDPERETLNLIPADNGKYYIKDENGNYWRVYKFIENAKTYETVEKPEHFYNSGKAFGKFQRLLSDFPAETLHETIPDFHNTKKRFEAFVDVLNQDRFNRASNVKPEIDFVLSREKEASLLVDMQEQGVLPLRVTHNDTKFNNVMIDDLTGQAICILDLDTVMPGLSLYDFGDSIRFGANPAAEDEKDLSKVWMELSLYKEFAKGYLEEASSSLTPAEIDNLAMSAKIITLECGMRFLTDYLNGDSYFKTGYPGQNIDRCRTQFKLVSDMDGKMENMKKIIRESL